MNSRRMRNCLVSVIPEVGIDHFKPIFGKKDKQKAFNIKKMQNFSMFKFLNGE